MSRTTNRLFFLVLVLALGGASACVVRGRVGTRVNAPPSMVAIDGGVYVVEGRSRPLFYDNGYYWRYDGGVWYRSTYYNSGFTRVRVGVVPHRIRTIRRPRRYVNYRARGRVKRRSVRARSGKVRRHNRKVHRRAPARRTRRPATRTHRTKRRTHQPATRTKRPTKRTRRPNKADHRKTRHNNTRKTRRPRRDRDHR